jgi:predicted choloylglycine hydrolase
LLDSIMAHIPPALWMLADAVRLRTANRFHDEANALAGQVGANWRDVILANISYDLVVAGLGCSTVALPTANGPVLARNMDWWPENILAQASYQLRYLNGAELRFVNVGWPGAIGVVTGLSARGFAFALNAVSSPEPVNQTGYPVLLALRAVLEDAANFEDALKLLSDEPLAAPCLIILVGTENEQRVVIERSPAGSAQRWPNGAEPLAATNHYRLLFQAETEYDNELYRTTCDRYLALLDAFAGHRAEREIDDAELLYVLTDPAILQSITAQHIILRPRSGQARLFVPRRFIPAEDQGAVA